MNIYLDVRLHKEVTRGKELTNRNFELLASTVKTYSTFVRNEGII